MYRSVFLSFSGVLCPSWVSIILVGLDRMKEYLNVKQKQDKVITADSAFIFLIIQSQNHNGQVGQGREDGLVWSFLC